jgi:hypothetical protein
LQRLALTLALAFVFVLATIHRLAYWLDAGFDSRCPIIGARLALLRFVHQLRLREKSIDSGSGDVASRNVPGAIPDQHLFPSIIVAPVSARFRFQETRLIQITNGAVATSSSPVLIPIEQGKLP